MSLTLTIILLVIFAGLAALASWRASRPAGLRPRMAPWRIVMLLAGAGALFMVVHLVNLAGVATGGNAATP